MVQRDMNGKWKVVHREDERNGEFLVSEITRKLGESE
jgi:hypothetical protein